MDNFLDKVVFRRFVLIVLFLNSIGLIGVLGKLVFKISLPSVDDLTGISAWASTADNKKLPLLIQYMASAAILAFYYLMGLFSINKVSSDNRSSLFGWHNRIIYIYVALTLLLNILLLLDISYLGLVFGLVWCVNLVWFFFNVYPAYLTKFEFLGNQLVKKILLIYILFQLGVIFVPHLYRSELVSNDYMEIPGQTILDNGDHVDIIDYINRHNIGGLYINDYRNPNFNCAAYRDGCDLKIKQDLSKALEAFLLDDEILKSGKYYYDYSSGEFCLHGVMSNVEFDLLNRYFADSESQLAGFAKMLALSRQSYAINKTKEYSAEETEFISKNKYELLQKAQAGWFFYHHNYFFGPMKAISLGAESKDQLMIYGWLVTKFSVTAMQYFDNVNYQSYFKLLDVYYLTYYLCFIFIIWSIFKDVGYVVLCGLGVLISLFFLGDQLISLAPGLNPVRHYYDIFMFLLFYKYIDTNKLVFIVSSLAFALLSVLWSKEFGFFSLIAITVSGFLMELIRGKRLLSLLYLVAFTFGLGLYVYPFYATNPVTLYALIGVSTPPTPSAVVILLLVSISIAYLGIINLISTQYKYAYFVLSLFIYCQLLGIYSVWYPEWHHILSLCAPVLFLLVSAHKALIDTGSRFNSVSYRNISNFFMFFTLVLSVVAAGFYFKEKYSYQESFKNHKLYNWDFDNAKFLSTMSPDLFSEAVNLIRRYNHDNSVYIFSKYDHILPVLANKYSNMPFNELATNMVTNREIHTIYEKINTDKPRYIFVDGDVDFSQNSEIVIQTDPVVMLFKHKYIFESSLSRALVLNNIRVAFHKVKSDYREIDRSRLIRVYERIDL